MSRPLNGAQFPLVGHSFSAQRHILFEWLQAALPRLLLLQANSEIDKWRSGVSVGQL